MLRPKLLVLSPMLLLLMGFNQDSCGHVVPSCKIEGKYVLASGECVPLEVKGVSGYTECAKDVANNAFAQILSKLTGKLDVGSINLALDNTPQLCATGAIGTTTTFTNESAKEPWFVADVTLTVASMSLPPLIVDVPAQPNVVLIDNGRTIVALATPIDVKARPSTETDIPGDASLTWSNAVGASQLVMDGTMHASTGKVRFDSVGDAKATVTMSQGGVSLEFYKEVIVKAPGEPLASATIRRIDANETGGCFGDQQAEASKLSGCAMKLCVDATNSRANWTTPGRPEQTLFKTYVGGVERAVPFYSDGVSPTIAVCDDDRPDVRVIVVDSGRQDATTLVPTR